MNCDATPHSCDVQIKAVNVYVCANVSNKYRLLESYIQVWRNFFYLLGLVLNVELFMCRI